MVCDVFVDKITALCHLESNELGFLSTSSTKTSIQNSI